MICVMTVILVIALDASAQTGTSSIRGTIADAQGQLGIEKVARGVHYRLGEFLI